MGRFGDEDNWFGDSNERTPKTIEEKAEMVAHAISGIVFLARDTRQSELRAQAMDELQRGESILDIDPTDINRIMGEIPTKKLNSKSAFGAGKIAGMNFLRSLPSHLNLSPTDRKMLYLYVFNAMVTAIQAEDSSSIGTKN